MVVKKIYLLKNSIKDYDWGSTTLMGDFFGYKNPENKPQAELWMGTHPRGISLAIDGKIEIALNKLISRDLIAFLGEKAAKTFKGLPFLFKALAAEKALSIQAHPNKKQAEDGFKNENKLGISIDAPNRNYRDDNHKPEVTCALSDEFWAMCGFRPIEEIIILFKSFLIPGFTQLIKILESNKSDESLCLQKFFESVSSLKGDKKERLIDEIIQSASIKKSSDPVCRWICRFYDLYGYDVGVLSPLYLNVFCLKKGQAVYLPAGELHAYLQGVAIELMANSDNVLRGGLTSKHIDVPELSKILNFQSCIPNILETEGKDGIYQTLSNEFCLSRIEFGPDYFLNSKNPAQIIFCSFGRITIEIAPSNSIAEKQRIVLTRGDAIFMPYHSGGYNFKGRGELFFAQIPL